MLLIIELFEFMTVENPEVALKYLLLFKEADLSARLGLINSIPSNGVNETLEYSLYLL